MEVVDNKTIGGEIVDTMDDIERRFPEESQEVEGSFDDTIVDREYLAISNSTGAEVHVFNHDVNETYDEGYKDGKTSGEQLAVVGIAAAVGVGFAIKKGIQWIKNRKAAKEVEVVEFEEAEVVEEPEEE